MAAPWAAGAEARIIGEIHGQQTVNVYHFATNTVVNDQSTLDEELLALAQALLDCVVQTLLPAVTQDWKVVRVEAKRTSPAISDPIIATAPANSIGELSACSHSFAASLMNVRTGQGGKRGRGRNFLPPPGETETVQSSSDAATLLLLVEFAVCLAGKFLGASPTTNWTLGVLSRADLKAIGGTFDNSFRIATSLSPVADHGIMGTRRKGRGA